MIITKDDFSASQARRAARERYAVAQRLEAEYLRSLRQLTRHIDHIVKGMAPNGVVRNSMELQKVLRDYSRTIEPWATSVAEKMISRIARKEASSWIALSSTMSRNLRKEIEDAPIGLSLRTYLNEQVKLITSLPVEAAERVHTLTLEGLVEGTRAFEIAAEILRTGEVTANRAKLIARTEVARTASGLTMARSLHVGCTHYIWRTSGDGDVRPSHKKMNGSVIPWATPPVLEDGTVAHAGMIYNCRCYPEPIITDD